MLCDGRIRVGPFTFVLDNISVTTPTLSTGVWRETQTFESGTLAPLADAQVDVRIALSGPGGQCEPLSTPFLVTADPQPRRSGVFPDRSNFA
jgi:hypothetical protein